MIIEIVNWAKYNPRSDVKHTTWFRLENTFWADPAIYRLDNDSKMVWIMVLSLASQKMKGSIDVEPTFISANLNIPLEKVMVSLKHLQDSERIKIPTSRPRHVHVTSTLLDSARTRASSNETNETNEQRVTKSNSCQLGVDLLAVWNANCGSLPKARGMNAGRLKHAKARLADNPEVAYWEQVVKRIASSDFCCGWSGGWKATFQWLLKPDTHLKVMEGQYDGKAKPQAQPKRSVAWDIPDDASRCDPNTPAVIPKGEIDGPKRS